MNYKRQEQVKELINKICSDCIVLPMCSEICTTYFKEVNKLLDYRLFVSGWLTCSKDVCDDAAIYIARQI